MSPRRSRGATLGLVAVCALVIVVLGIAIFALLRIMGGNRETTNAVDAGALNTAKQAIRTPTVDTIALGTPEFDGLGETGDNKISLITYNRAVARTILVAMNAQDEGTDTARQNARLVAAQLEKLGAKLASSFNGNELKTAFTNLAGSNNTRMLDSLSGVTSTGDLRTAFLKPGGSTNVYFNQSSLSAGMNLAAYLNTEATSLKAPDGSSYLKGYLPISVGGVVVVGTPVFPQQKPHLIASADFEASNKISAIDNAKLSTIPPNSFSCKGQAQQQSTAFMGAVSAAVVGTLDKQFVAKVPLGYIRFVNGPGLLPPGVVGGGGGGAIAIASDGDSDIFNKELFSPSHVAQSTNQVFTTDVLQIAAWIAYNNSSGDDANSHDGNLYPPKLGFNASKMRFGPSDAATEAQLLAIRAQECDCTHTMYDVDCPGACKSSVNLRNWTSNYGRRLGATSMIEAAKTKFTAIEWTKCLVLKERMKGGVNPLAFIPLPPNPTGMKVFNHNIAYPYSGGELTVGKEGTPWQLMQMIGSCATDLNGSVYSALFRRCQQIQPGYSNDQIKEALNSKIIGLGETMYLYINGSGKFVLDSTGPAYKTEILADGNSDPTSSCEIEYLAEGLSVNTVRDCNFQDKPYSDAYSDRKKAPPVPPTGIDRALWTASSGYQNLLGVVEFQNTMTGSSEFSHPN